MSMPQPIHVALVGTEAEQVLKAARSFRLSEPGIGSAYLVAINAGSGGKVSSFREVPRGRIHLWVCLDRAAFDRATEFHQRDVALPGYARGFYEEVFPEACVIVEPGASGEQKRVLVQLARKVVSAWHESS